MVRDGTRCVWFHFRNWIFLQAWHRICALPENVFWKTFLQQVRKPKSWRKVRFSNYWSDSRYVTTWSLLPNRHIPLRKTSGHQLMSILKTYIDGNVDSVVRLFGCLNNNTPSVTYIPFISHSGVQSRWNVAWTSTDSTTVHIIVRVAFLSTFKTFSNTEPYRAYRASTEL